MRYVSEDRLKQIAAMPASVFEAPASEIINYLISKECQELQESWMTLYEFLRSGFVGECWIFTDYEVMERAYYDARGFRGSKTTNIGWPNSCITHVMPIHEPEPPR